MGANTLLMISIPERCPVSEYIRLHQADDENRTRSGATPRRLRSAAIRMSINGKTRLQVGIIRIAIRPRPRASADGDGAASSTARCAKFLSYGSIDRNHLLIILEVRASAQQGYSQVAARVQLTSTCWQRRDTRGPGLVTQQILDPGSNNPLAAFVAGACPAGAQVVCLGATIPLGRVFRNRGLSGSA